MLLSRRYWKTLLFPQPELQRSLSKKAWKFQIVFAIFMLTYLVFAAIDGNSIGFLYMAIAFTFRCVMLLCGRLSSKIFLAGCTACVVVDTACNIMAHPEMQNTVWLPIYDRLPGNDGPPCPWCLPDIESSMIFGINISYMLMFVLPFCYAACTVPLCFAAYVSCLVYSRYNNYVPFGEELAQEVKNITTDELILLSGILIFNITAKMIMETSESELWYALTESQGTVLHEKILRCKAEYASECVKTTAIASEKEDNLSSYCATSVEAHNQAKSIASAPPILESQSLMAYNDEYLDLQCASTCRGDCLQQDDVVWTNESPHPIPVKQVVKGQHVLCYDHLSKGLKHAEVLSVTMQADSVQWATIRLTDGTSIRVTADHPFLTEEEHGLAQIAVRASELKPHFSKVRVMKLVSVDVQSVDLDPLGELKEQARVALDIQQPARHSVFVSRRDQPVPENPVAVGASNLDLIAEEYLIGAQRTFLDISMERPMLRRTNSSPGCLESILTECTTKVSVAPSVSASRQSTSSYRSTSSPSTLESDIASLGSDGCSIRVGAKLRPVRDPSGTGLALRSIVAPDGDDRASLQDYLNVRRSGLPSLGSIQHREGLCSAACWFENQRQHGRLKKCSVGVLCERCHCDHTFLKRRRRALQL